MSEMQSRQARPHIRPVRDLRNNYTELAEIIEKHDPVFITNNGRGEAVLINIEDYADYEEYLLHKYILKKLEEAESSGVWHSFEDVSKETREKLIERL